MLACAVYVLLRAYAFVHAALGDEAAGREQH
jgi:hypothetical protein